MDRNTLLEEIKEKLLAENKRLEEELGKIGTRDEKSGAFTAAWEEYGSNEEDNAAEVAAFNDAVSLTGALNDQRAEVQAALEQIEKGTYGICVSCGVHIDPERLRVKPMSTYCIACQQKRDG